MGNELLETGELQLKRSEIDAGELRGIRVGAWTYEELEEYTGEIDKTMEPSLRKSTLPVEP